MPADTIKRAIDKAVGAGAAEQFVEIVYEGYGPGGVAILVETATDNKNRTASDVRSVFSKNGGSLAGAGSVAWQFEQRGIVAVARNGKNADDIALEAIDLGADDVDTDSDPIEVLTGPATLEKIRKDLEAAGIKIESAEVTMAAKTPIDVDRHVAEQNLRLIEHLEDLEDVQRVTANFNLPQELLAEAAAV
jgi:YebC/PmpR family DNA-binding regulatory protein